MAPNTSSVFNKAPPQPQQPESKASDAGVLVVAPPQSIEPSSSVPACDVLSVASSSAAASLTSIATASAAATGVPTSQASAAALANALRTDECSSTTTGCLRRRRRHADRFSDVDDAATASADASADEDAAALAASERHFQQQLQMSRFARVSPAALDGLKPFRKSCLKRSSSELPADLSALKHEAAAAAAAHRALVTSPPAPLRPVQKNRRRCWECKAKVALTAVTCRCDYTFCNKHRYAEEHKCSFDFKVSAKRQLESENPRVVPSKVARIN